MQERWCNLLANGDFARWSHGEIRECEDRVRELADGWFGRRGARQQGMVAERCHGGPGRPHAMRIRRCAGDAGHGTLGVVRTLDARDDLAGQRVLVRLEVRKRPGLTAEGSKVEIIVYAGPDEPQNDPFSPSGRRKAVANKRVAVGDSWSSVLLDARVPRDARYVAVAIRVRPSGVAPEEDAIDVANATLYVDVDRSGEPPEDAPLVFHLASMARSGETVLLRQLSAHPKVHNLVNLYDTDDPASRGAFEYLKSYRRSRISRDNPALDGVRFDGASVLLLKQGVWEHPHPFAGVVLARNPVGVYSSMIGYGAPDSPDESFYGKTKRAMRRNFQRWMRDIDPDVVASLDKLDALEQFCVFYNRRMGALAKVGRPIVHYERLCAEPRRYLKLIVEEMGVGWDDTIADAHRLFGEARTGHGRIDLARPLDTKSITKWRAHVSAAEFEQIVERTRETCAALGYRLAYPEIEIVPQLSWA